MTDERWNSLADQFFSACKRINELKAEKTELVEALRQAVSAMTEIPSDMVSNRMAKAIEDADEAIAKATGEA